VAVGESALVKQQQEMVGLQMWVLILTASPCPLYRAVYSLPLQHRSGEKTPRQKQQQLVASNLGSWDVAPLSHVRKNVQKFQNYHYHF